MIAVKQYLLFGFEQYYPAGGADDFVQAFDTVEEAAEFMEKNPNMYDYYNILDLATLTMEASGEWTQANTF